jgi:hypothetical protein
LSGKLSLDQVKAEPDSRSTTPAEPLFESHGAAMPLLFALPIAQIQLPIGVSIAAAMVLILAALVLWQGKNILKWFGARGRRKGSSVPETPFLFNDRPRGSSAAGSSRQTRGAPAG